MKRITAVVATGAVAVLGLAVAVPALASTSSDTSNASGSSSSSGLTSAQQQSIEAFLADHPNLAEALAGRAAGWAKLIAANPAIQTELTKVLALPADQRQAELKAWLKANPTSAKALQAYRKGLKEQRIGQQKDRLDKRLQRLQGKTPGSSASPSSSA
jgi:hemophore-related protein